MSEECVDGWCRIPAGCFVSGSPEDEIGRARYDESESRVTLTHDFEIQETELTLAQWEAPGLFEFPNSKIGLDGSGPCRDTSCPVKNATWYQTLQYANWLSEQRGMEQCFRVFDCAKSTESEGRGEACSVELLAPSIYECEGYRLPTSAEWEYAARAGTTTAFYSGPITSFEHNDWCNWDPNLVRVAWYCANVPTLQEQPVGQLLPNAWGLRDVLGNVYEWSMDRNRGLVRASESVDPEAVFDVGGSATTHSCRVNSPAELCRVASKLSASRDTTAAGFRLARTLGVGTLPTLADIPAAATSSDAAR